MHADDDNDVRLPSGCNLLLIANFFTGFPEPSGGTRHFVEMAKSWQQAGQSLTVVTPRIGKLNCETEGFHGPFRIVPPAWALRLGTIPSILIWGLISIPRIPWRKKPLVFYSTSPLLPDIIAAYAARLVKRECVYWAVCLAHLILKPSERGGRRLTDTVSYLAQQVGNALIKHKGDMIIVDTRMLKEELIKRGFREDRIFVTSFGAGGGSVTESLPFEYDACYLGRLHPSKGLAELLRIWDRVSKKRPGSKLAVVGTGEMLEGLRVQVRSAGLEDQIRILGYLPRAELERVLASSKVFVFPSHEEGFGISLVEAMAFGLPVVAYALPHYPEVFGEVPMTAPIGDEEMFARLVLDLLEDETLRRRKSEESKNLSLLYTWPEVTKREATEISRRVTLSLGDPARTPR